MGKKVKSKGRSPRKAAHRPPRSAATAAAAAGDQSNRETCNHYTKDGAELDRILARLRSAPDSAAAAAPCEHCRDEPANKRGKQGNKKAGGRGPAPASPEIGSTWVCLDCGRFFCGGAVRSAEPYGHARRHSKQERHPWAAAAAALSSGALMCWCFTCNLTVPIPTEMLKSGNEEGREDSVEGEIESGGAAPAGRVMRGLANLGNTCFLNSVMQNLFSIDLLRSYFASLDRPVGPITMALKKLFAETSSGATADSRSVLSPKGLLGCICAKAPQFRGYQQQDSHEYLRCLLDGLYTEEVNARKTVGASDEKDNANSILGGTFVDIIFGGQLSSTVCCMECGHTSVVHEPFLDLSLPLPKKKPQPRKVPVPPPKKSKQFMRDENSSRKFREKGSAKVSMVIEPQQKEGYSMPSECSESYDPQPPQEQTINPNVVDDSSWLDYVGSDMAPDALDFVSENSDACVEQSSDGGKILESENNVQCTLESHADGCGKELMVPLNSSAETSCWDEVPLSCVPDLQVLLLPYKELDSAVDGMHRMKLCIEDSENPTPADASVQESSLQVSSVAVPEKAEEDFDGFGDLFNEPETASDLNADRGTTEEMDMSFCAGNSSESNQEEIDDSNSPVSLNSCLALFTKPELLSDEHGWYCEHCSEISSDQEERTIRGSRQVVLKLNQSEASTAQEDGQKTKIKDASDNSDEGGVCNCEQKVVGNGMTTSTSMNSVLNFEPNASNMLLNLVEGSEISNPASNDQTDSHFVVTKDDVSGESEHNQKQSDLSETASSRISMQSSFNEENGSRNINDRSDARDDGHALLNASNSSSHLIEETTKGTCENNNFTEKENGKIRSQLSCKVPRKKNGGSEETKTERRKVKRDATKRFLISKPPPILTIHLKRFSQDARGRLSKLSGHVNFQETIDLRPYMDPRNGKDVCLYRLVGVVEHSGTMRGGHYIAYVRGEKGAGKAQKGSGPGWFYASDAHVSETSLSEVLQSEAYILFYERV